MEHAERSWVQGGHAWKAPLVVGILFAVIGAASMLMPQLSSLAVDLILGWLLLASGIIQVISAAFTRKEGGVWIKLIRGLVFIAAGLLLLFRPYAGVLTLTLILAVFLVVEGIAEVVTAIQVRRTRGWGWLLASGIAATILGVLIWARWPISGTWALGLLVGLKLLLLGWAVVMMSLAIRVANRLQERPYRAAGEPAPEA
ncbi:MAG TPA: HdeD family acid-resistance protein [Phycisphaerae bacterium]|nr:HdeD family acid-resistance protein [Phycisphaerae bacterium]